ncbi:hypothetical protein L596_010066 [Steinernema carpocapsae]|uniref:ATP-grasp domain-containing protein n=1 Tax=Steinernema carpocapsae TaxID=34508 RepID=A0A4U5PH78_STECR|nr:hypothetical protein L596_010066 [Steinernema carpocapsae]
MMVVDDPKEATLSAPTLDSSTSVLCKADREALLNLVEEKSRIAFVIKHGRSLFRKLNGLKENKPTDVGLVAFVPEEAKKTISPEVESCFDWIVYYDDSETHVDNLILTLTSCTAIPLPDFDQFVTELLNFIPKDKLILIHAEEFTMTVLSGIREKHGLKGACLEDIDRLCRKERVVEIAENAGILIAKSVFVDFAALPSKTEILEKVTVKVQTFPMFVKPTRMAGSTGTAKLENMEDLERWVDTTMALEEASTYLVQEYVRGREFSVVIVLLQDGLWKPLVVKWNHKDLSNYEGYFKDGLIMARRLRFDDAKNGMFPGIDDFAQQVINAFKPVHPQVFFLQGFQDLNDPMRYYLNELGYRPPGGDHTNDAFYWTCEFQASTSLRPFSSLTWIHTTKPNRTVLGSLESVLVSTITTRKEDSCATMLSLLNPKLKGKLDL